LNNGKEAAFVDIDESVPGFVDETDGALTLDDFDDANDDGETSPATARPRRSSATP
jgi:hypothetical protein